MSFAAAFWLLLAVAVPTYWALPARWRTGFLAGVSYAFVLYLDLGVGVSLGAWALLFWALSRRGAGGHKSSVTAIWLVVPVLLFLAYFKYLPPLVAAIGEGGARKVLVPLGLSYFCFKLIHYAIEARRRPFASDRLDDFLAYVFLFPTFTAGPIERFDHFLQFRQNSWRRDDLVEGVTRIAHGLIKKFVICEALLLPQLHERNGIYGIIDLAEVLPAFELWSYFLKAFLYLYLDFSAYSDIAIGASLLFGVRIAENFRWPLLAANIPDFWRRWHLSLSNWCQTYVYLPMIGATRRPIVATMSSFLVIGLWHGATWSWISWGLLHGAGVVAHGYWYRAKRKWGIMSRGGWLGAVASRSLTLGFVVLVGVLTALDGKGAPKDALRIIGRMVGF